MARKMMLIGNELWCCAFVLAAGLGLAGPVRAADPQSPMHWPAIAVRAPAQALLISVARAGNRLVAVGGHGVIIYSDDNGQNWRQAEVPVSETITCVAFADAKDGWAAGDQGVVLHTDDGGVSWKIQLTGDQVLGLMTKAAAAYAAAHPGDEAADLAVRRAGILKDAGDDKPFLTILAQSPQEAEIFGAYRIAVRTTDGGKSWQDWSLHVDDPVSHNIYKVAQDGQALFLTGEDGTVLRSDDGGQNYATVTVPDENTFLGILGTPKGAVLTYGVAGEIYRSADEGKNWTPVQSPASSDLTDGIVLRSGAILLTSEDGNLFISHDDGQNFAPVGANLKMGVFGLTQAANGDVVFVGSGGVRVEPAALFAAAQ